MKQAIRVIDPDSIGFSFDNIRKRYSKKEDFIADVINVNNHLEKKALTEVLEKIWDESSPKEEKNVD